MTQARLSIIVNSICCAKVRTDDKKVDDFHKVTTIGRGTQTVVTSTDVNDSKTTSSDSE